MTAANRSTVAVINRYPVKSMLGEQLDQVVVGAAGLVGDRAYAVVSQEDGKIGSAKHPGKWRGLLACQATFTAEPQPGAPLPPVVIVTPDGQEVRSDDPKVHAVLSQVLDRDVRLVSTAGDAPPVLEEVWPEGEDEIAPDEFVQSTLVGATDEGEQISDIPLAFGGMFAPQGSFFDLATLHLLTTATLARLAELEPAASFDQRRYRPNFLLDVDGSEFVENDWVGGTVALGGEVVAAVALPTMRCVMTTLAQEELPVDRATLRTIARHNRLEITGFGTWACAGVYATVAGTGTVTVGDVVEPTVAG